MEELARQVIALEEKMATLTGKVQELHQDVNGNGRSGLKENVSGIQKEMIGVTQSVNDLWAFVHDKIIDRLNGIDTRVSTMEGKSHVWSAIGGGVGSLIVGLTIYGIQAILKLHP
jgi:hypothetical protein